MKTQRFSKVIIFTVCILLVFAVAAALLFSSNSSLPANDNVIADSGEGAGEVASATASTNAPLEDGSVPSGYSPASGATGTTSIDTIRSNPSGNYYLTGEMYIEEMDYSTNQNTTFSGTLDGCGNTIYVSVSGQNYGKEGGALFTGINGGTIKNVKIVVNKFSYGNVGTDEDRKAGIIAAYMVNGATINNVRVELNYVPTTSTTGDNMQNDNTYYVDTKTHDKATKYTYLGGLVGTSEDGNNTISNCTVVNNATGAGFGANVKNTAGIGFGSVNSTLAVGLFVGSTISNNSSATLNMTNIRVKFGTGAVISSNHYQTSNGTRNYYAGAVLGWVKSETTAKFDGVIYDTAIDKDNYIKSANYGTNYKGTLYGYNEGGTVNVTSIYASSAISSSWNL